MDPKQVSPQVGVNSGSVGSSATGSPVFANPANNFRGAGAGNRFQDTNSKGDIIIPPSDGSSAGGAKSPLNKKLIIGIVAGVVALVAAIILVIVFTGGNKSGKPGGSGSAGGSSVVEDASVAEKFNKYANFIISGEASGDRIPEGDEDAIVIAKIIDHDAEFIDEAKAYFTDFYDSLKDSEDAEDILKNTAYGYADIFDFIYRFTKSQELSRNTILTSLKENGEAKTKEMVDSRLAIFQEDEASSTSKRYAEAMSKYIDALIKQQTNLAESSGGETVQELSAIAGNIKRSALTEIVSECFIIDHYIYDDADNEEAVDE